MLTVLIPEQENVLRYCNTTEVQLVLSDDVVRAYMLACIAFFWIGSIELLLCCTYVAHDLPLCGREIQSER